MNHGHPNDAKVIDLSQQANFFSAHQRGGADMDPNEPTALLIDVDRIKAYDHNPRRGPNPAREDIKESIRASGKMDQALTITRRPGEEHYMVAAGGNTRLENIQELWHETKDERYRQVHCLFRPWSNDGDVLVAHLTENDVRGNLTFLDRALAVQDLRDLIEDEIGEELSPADLERSLKERGYPVNRNTIRKLQYTVDVLYPAIPTLLARGLGKTLVERIRALQLAYSAIWDALDLGPKDAAEEIFVAVLARFEELGAIDFDGPRLDLCDELMVCSDLSVFIIRNAFDAALEGRPMRSLQANASPQSEQPPGDALDSAAQSPPLPASESVPPRAQTSQRLESPPDTQTPPPPSASPATEPGAATEDPQATADTGGGNPPLESASATDVDAPTRDDSDEDGESASAKPTLSPGGSGPELDPERVPAVKTDLSAPARHSDLALSGDLQALRREACQAAVAFAAETRIGDIVIPFPKMGLGFFVGPADESLVATSSDEEVHRVMASWWSLVILSEQFARHGAAIRYMPAAWRDRPIGEAMRHARTFRVWTEAEANRTEEVISEIPIIGMPDMALGFVGCSDAAWRSWTQVAASCRAIHRATHGHPWVYA